MDIYDEDIMRFWNLLNDNHVDYIMVGGFAVNMHGFSRTTNVIDIWVKDTKSNRIQLGKVMSVFGYDDVSWEEIEFLPGWTDFIIGNGIVLDILISMKGLEDYSFDECLFLSSTCTIQDIKVPFLHINHLLANKIAVNRPKDQIDVIELEKIVTIRKELGLD
jgi:hypothetical protein